MATVLRHDWRKPHVLASIHATARFHLRTWFLDWTAAPQQWNTRLIELTFSDLYLPEEFGRLFRGLERLRRRCTRLTFLLGRDATKWMAEAHHRVGGASLNYAYLDFGRLPRRYQPTLLSGVHVWLVQVSSSIVTATFIADPSAKLRDHFAALAASDRSGEVDPRRVSWKHGMTSGSFFGGVGMRQTEYDELFLSANAEMCRVLRRYIGVGLAMDGPLPWVESIAVDRPLSELPASYERSDDDLPRWRGVSYLHSLGAPPDPWRTFRTSWYKLYTLDRDEAYNFGAYQLFASASDHAKARQELRVADDRPDASMRHSLNFVHYSLGGLIALEAFYRRVRHSVLDVRNDIVPILQERGARRLRRLAYGQRRIARANALAYREARVWTELRTNAGWDWFTREVGDLQRPRDDNRHIDEMSFVADVRWRLKAMHRFVNHQMSLIRPAYREILDYRVIEINDRLQRRVLLLAVIAAIAAIADLLPESMRETIINAVQRALR